MQLTLEKAKAHFQPSRPERGNMEVAKQQRLRRDLKRLFISSSRRGLTARRAGVSRNDSAPVA